MESAIGQVNVAAEEQCGSAARFQLLMEHSRDVLCELRDGRVAYISPNCHTLSGYDSDYYVGKSPLELVHPDDRGNLLPYFAPGWAGTIVLNFRILDAHGVWRWREAVGTRIIEEDGRPRSVMVFRDSDERHRAEDALRRSEGRSRAQLAAIPDLMFVIRRDGCILDFKADDPSDLYAPADTLIGRNVLDTLPPELAVRVIAGIALALTGGGAQSLEYTLVKKGELREYETRIAAAGDEAVIIARDVTQRNRSERQVNLAREHTAVLEERERIARELHDTVAQYFFGIGMATKELADRESVSKAILRRKLGYVRGLASEGGKEVRRAVSALAPAARTDGLDDSLHQLVTEVRAGNAIEVEYAGSGPIGSLAPDVQDDLFRAAREALYNARRHARATRVVIRLTVDAAGARLSVADDGWGDAAKVEQAILLGRGYGLRSLRDHFVRSGGELRVGDNAGRGIEVSFLRPLERAA